MQLTGLLCVWKQAKTTTKRRLPKQGSCVVREGCQGSNLGNSLKTSPSEEVWPLSVAPWDKERGEERSPQSFIT